jgi:DnaA family protein
MTGFRQLPLAVALRDDSSFESFLPAVNPEALAAVQALISGAQPFVYLFGEAGTGRTHLLEAAIKAGGTGAVVYVAMAGSDRPGPEMLTDVGQFADLVCLDDIDQIAGDARWEEVLFHLFNALGLRGARLLVSARSAPRHVEWGLPDLGSRMCSGLAVRTAVLNDDDKLNVLVFRAARRGLDLSPEAGRYLLARVGRRLEELVGWLERLDRAALTHQRRLSIPFVRQILMSAE